MDLAAIGRLLTRRDIPLREKTLWRMLYETTARAGEILALNIENLELDARRARITAKGGATKYGGLWRLRVTPPRPATTIWAGLLPCVQ